MALRAKLYLDGGCVKSLLPPAAAEYYFERHLISDISRSEISEMRCRSKDNLARSAIKRLFTQPPSKEYFAAAGGKNLFTQPQAFYTTPRSANKKLLKQLRRNGF